MEIIDFARVNRAALTAYPGILEHWLPDGRFQGREYVCGSVKGEPGRSLSVNVDSGVWKDFAGEEGGTDPVSLYAAIKGLSQGEAARELADELNLVGNGNGARPTAPEGDAWTPILPVPDDAPEPPKACWGRGRYAHTWTYKDAQGHTLGLACRFNSKDGSKEVLPLAYCQGPQDRAWKWKSMPTPRPLYGLDSLAKAQKDAPVLVLEGEKCADAAQRLLPGVVAMTWPGGSKAVSKADWTPLRGRTVAIWPDADEPGQKAGQAVVDALIHAGAAAVDIVTVPEGVAEGWDIADAEADGWTQEQALAYLEAKRSPARAQSNKSSDAPETAEPNDDEQPAALLPDPPALPEWAFPSAVFDLLSAVAEAVTAPIEVSVAALLGVAGAAIGRARGLEIKPGWIEYPNLYLGLVARSGIGKSPGMKMLMEPIFKGERRYFEQWQAEMAWYEEELATWQTGKKKQGGPGPKPEKPAQRQLYADDATTEALTVALDENPKGILWYRDELAGLLLDLDRYNGKDGATKTRLMTAYDSGPWKTSRVNSSRASYIPSACLSILGTVQPQVLASIFTANDLHSGFLSRFSFIRAAMKQPPEWTENSLSSEWATWWQGVYGRLASLDLDGDSPVIIRPTAEAKDIFVSWFNALAREPWLNPEASGQDGLYAKLRGQALRLALIVHCLEAAITGEEERRPLERYTMERAIALADWLKEHQRQCWRLLGGAGHVSEASPLDRRIAHAVVALAGEVASGCLPVSRIAEQVNAGASEQYKVDARAVGRTLKRLKLTTRKGGKGVRLVAMDEGALARMRLLAA